MPVSIGKTNSISGIKAALDQPEFAAAIGLVKVGSSQQRKRTTRKWSGDIKETFKQMLGRA
jgi:cell division ATPase FtsA